MMQIFCVLWAIYNTSDIIQPEVYIGTVLQVNLNVVSQLHLQMFQIIAHFSGVIATQYLFFFWLSHAKRVFIV